MALNTHSIDLELGSLQYLTNGSPTAALQLTSNLSLETWIQFESLPGSTLGYAISMRNTTDGKTNYSLALDTSSGSKLSFFHRNSSAQAELIGVNWSPSTGTWYHIAVTVGSSTAKFYVNGSQQGTNQALSYAFDYSSGSDLWIGSRDSTNQTVDGKLDEVRIWNDVRTVTEINDNKSKHISASEAGLVGYWRLNNSYVDEKGANDLTAVNSPVFSTDVPFVGSADSTGGSFLLNML